MAKTLNELLKGSDKHQYATVMPTPGLLAAIVIQVAKQNGGFIELDVKELNSLQNFIPVVYTPVQKDQNGNVVFEGPNKMKDDEDHDLIVSFDYIPGPEQALVSPNSGEVIQ